MRNDDVILQLYLIRHGESMGNIETDEVFDAVNPPLTSHGVLQAAALSDRMADVKLDAVYSSPLQRAISTAMPTVEKTKAPVKFDPVLCETDVCVDLKGFCISRETYEECALRAEKFIDFLLDNHKGNVVAVVTHGEFMQFLIRAALKIFDARFCVYNASLTKIKFYADEPAKLAFQNDISHLLNIDGDKTEWM